MFYDLISRLLIDHSHSCSGVLSIEQMELCGVLPKFNEETLVESGDDYYLFKRGF